MRRHLGRSAVRSRLRSAAGYLTVLKNNFAGTQAAEMSEDPPLTYFCRSRGTCDTTSVRSRQSRLGCTTEVAKELQFHANNLAPLVEVLSTPKELNAGTWKRSVRAARGRAHSASTQPPRGASTEAPWS